MGTMEINPRHPIVVELLKRSEESPEDSDTKDLAWILHDTWVLNSGFPVSDAKQFSGRMYRMLKNGLALDSLDLVPEIEVPEEEEEDAEEDTEKQKWRMILRNRVRRKRCKWMAIVRMRLVNLTLNSE